MSNNKNSIDHVLLTRFNLPSPGVETLIRAREGWLRERVELFEAYCLPSLAEQSDPDFHWLVYFDPESPAWLRERIRVWSDTSPLRPFFRAQVSLADRLHDMRQLIGSHRDRLLTTNLDNDDALAWDFIERIKAGCPTAGRAAIYLEWGLIRHGNRIYLHRDPDNAFCSVIEDWNNPVTCWIAQHNQLAKTMRQVRLGGEPAWMQIIHERNVSNRVRGRQVAVSPYRNRFVGLSSLPEASRQNLVSDRCLGAPRRALLNGTRNVAKYIVMLAGGQTTSEVVKVAWYKFRSTF